MDYFGSPVSRLIEELSRLPGIGRKSAQRLAFHVIRMPKEEAQASEIDELVEKKFEGSLPAFVAAFTKRQTLSAGELDQLQSMIDRIRKGDTP